MPSPGRPRLLLILLLSAFTLTTLDARAGAGSPLEALRVITDRALGPAQGVAGAAARSARDLLDGDSAEEQRLREENDRLRAELVLTEDLRRRGADLDALLALTAAGTYTVVPARVVTLGSALGFSTTVTLDAGSDDGVREGQTVLSGAGLVGRTVRVGPRSSTVLLLTDPGFTAGARLTREGTIGLASGTGRSLTYELVEGGRVEVGDALLTTGSQTFVPGVPVGRVAAVDPAGGGLLVTATVEPFADVATVDLVGIVVEPPRGTPRVPIPPAAVPPAAVPPGPALPGPA